MDGKAHVERRFSGRRLLLRSSLAACVSLAWLSGLPMMSGADVVGVQDVLSAPHVVLYGHSGLSAHAAQTVVQGARLPSGGCAFTFSGVGSATQSMSRHETAFDPATCRAVLTIQPATAFSATPSLVYGKALLALPGKGAVLAATSTHYQDAAYVHSYFQDPVGIHVNDVWNDIQWNPGNGCADNGNALATQELQWYSQDGWVVVSNKFLASFTCYENTSGSNSHFQNGAFCSGANSDTYYQPQLLNGFADGTYNWSIHWENDGPCYSFLGFNEEDGPYYRIG